MENEYCAKHWRVLVNQLESFLSSNFIPSGTSSRFCQSLFDPYDLSSDNEEYLTPSNVAKTTPGWSDRAAPLLTTARLSLNSPPEAPKNRGQINLNLNDYHSDPLEVSSTFWILDITDWWHEQGEMHSKYADLFDVAHNVFSIIQHGVGVEASFCLGRDVIGWRQSKTTCTTLCKKVVVRKFAQANNRILAGDNPVSDMMNTENDSEMKKLVEESTVHRTVKVHNFLEMWQSSQNLCAAQKVSFDQYKQMAAVEYIWDPEEIIKTSWSLFQHDGVAAFKLSERSPLPQDLSPKDLASEWNQILNVHRIRTINHHPVERGKYSTSEIISNTENWLNWNSDMDNAIDSRDNCAADDRSDVDPHNRIEDPDFPEQEDVSATPNVPQLVRPTQKSQRQAGKVMHTVNAIETRRNKRVKKMSDWMRQWVTSIFM